MYITKEYIISFAFSTILTANLFYNHHHPKKTKKKRSTPHRSPLFPFVNLLMTVISSTFRLSKCSDYRNCVFYEHIHILANWASYVNKTNSCVWLAILSLNIHTYWLTRLHFKKKILFLAFHMVLQYTQISLLAFEIFMHSSFSFSFLT